MPRQKPAPDDAPRTLSFSVPGWLYREVVAEVPEGYGAQTRLFQRVWHDWKSDRNLREENARLRARVVHLDRAFRKVRTAVEDAES